jgi:hypothetical protein
VVGWFFSEFPPRTSSTVASAQAEEMNGKSQYHQQLARRRTRF